MATCGIASKSGPNVAVILAGCGVNDGTEIHEASAVMTHLTRNGATLQCFAPDIPQMHVIDHSKGSEDSSHTRSVLAESGRIARGNITPLKDLLKDVKNFDAVVVPGGFGAAKNLSDFAGKGAEMTVNCEVAEVLKCFQKSKKPIGMCCIAPILAANLFKGVTITLGKKCPEEKWPFKDAIDAAQKMGAKTEEKGVDEVSIDCENNVYSTPAFMYAGDYHEIDDGIGNMIKKLVKAVKK